jgi:threonylcarbamoyladenosine tRNA methylthiotransferase MtaB
VQKYRSVGVSKLKRIALTTLGCKANQYDSECIAAACRSAGFEVVDFENEADAYIINTCTVTAIADQQARQMLRRTKRNNPNAKVIAVGCSVQNNRDDYEAIDEVDAVFGVRATDEIVAFLCHSDRAKRVEESLAVKSQRASDPSTALGMTGRVRDSSTRPSASLGMTTPVHQSRARVLLKIQDGCDRRCTYCAVWKARGPSASVAVDDVRKAYRALSHYPEVIITGIHIGQYGDDLDEGVSICNLVDELSDGDGPRIRLSSLNPDEFDEDLVRLLKEDRVCRHVHLSVQSLSDPVIRAMGRSYAASDVERIVKMLCDSVPGLALGADIIAGFPGETDDDHRTTMEMIEKLPFSYLHVFPYSERPGTRAADMEHQVPKSVRKARAGQIIDLARVKRKEFYEQQVGETVEAVVVSRRPDACGCVRAVADNYVTLVAPQGPAYGSIARARIEKVKGEEVSATWC